MPLHTDSERVLRALDEQGFPAFEQVSVAVIRELLDGLIQVQGPPAPMAQVTDTSVPGPGGPIPVRVYRPGPPDGRPRPLVVFFHGGGWVAGSVDLVDRPLRGLAAATGAVVASVGYRLAPETRFPGPVLDAYAAVDALALRAAEFGAAPDRLVVAGESAGANLATAACRIAVEHGGPDIGLQLLICPITAPARDSPFPSYQEHARGYVNTRAAMEHFWDLYLARPEDATHPWAAPLLADDLSRQPPALILTAEYDPLRDEGEEYGRRLRAAGVPTTVSRYAGMLHIFFLLPRLTAFQEAVDEVGRALRARW
ncbi:alpha/beta hydrolase [Streptomyces alboniger]|uniref:Alpha/beta hydrolase n=1 Tax=Streptomyces alboniger TaxID=132473 RepID=A0A5J6HRE3_STRAD|nr:alpha/beta hydrolase [Streptomyces alboniger]QEV21762.1 alpha/beta hydrolase [Streptomyces alboniger]